PYELPEDVAPQNEQKENETFLPELLQAAATHPTLQAYQFKISELQIDQRLKFQLLLPQVDVKYNHIGREFSTAVKQPFFENNYRYGITMSLPLRLSEGRGAYKAAQLKVEQARLARSNKLLELQNKVKAYYTEWQQTTQQLQVQEGLVANLTTLQKGEETKFRNGESSLFLINAREQKTIEGQQKLFETVQKNRQAAVNLQWAAGLFGNL
ncbi:MAG: TolC family protein, partial [Chitinophagaceae bacterium]